MTTFWPAVIRTPASSVSRFAVRRMYTTGLTQRSSSSTADARRASRSASEPRQLVGVGEQRVKAAGHEVAGGVAAGVDQQQEEQSEVDDVEVLAVDRREGDDSGQVVGRLGPAGLPHTAARS